SPAAKQNQPRSPNPQGRRILTMAVRLKPGAKILLTLIVVGGLGWAAYTYYWLPRQGSSSGGGFFSSASNSSGKKSVYKVALSEWPGHMAMVLGNGGLKTQPGSAAADEGLNLEVVFIEDPIRKNAALQSGDVDFV